VRQCNTVLECECEYQGFAASGSTLRETEGLNRLLLVLLTLLITDHAIV
jgi:hypothetical protein